MSDNRTWIIELIRGSQCRNFCEVGVWQGGFSQRVLDETNVELVQLIDPWAYDQGEIPKNYFVANSRICKSQDDMDKIYQGVVDRFSNNPRVSIKREFSHLASDCFQDESFDAIYIDGCHGYEDVKRDLESWLPKVGINKYLMGDDYDWGHGSVKKAVDEFILRKDVSRVAIKNGQWALKRTR